MDYNQFVTKFNDTRIKLGDSCINEPIVLSVNSSTIGTLGNISASVGKAKSGKSFNVAIIVSAMLSNRTILNYSSNLPVDKKRIIYIDTEQSKYHCAKVINRISIMSDLSKKDFEDRLFYFSLREFNVVERVNFIDNVVNYIDNVGLLVIDGLRDLLYDFNCPIESSKLMNKLMWWSSQYMLHIHTVLHVNKSDDNTRGHLGSELNNKCESILHISKRESNVCVVKPLLTRDKDFVPFSFMINEDGIPSYDVNHTYCNVKSKRGVKIDEIEESQHREALNNAIGDQIIYGYSELLKLLKQGYLKVGLDFGDNKIIAVNQFLSQNHIIIKQGRGYKFNKEFKL